MKYAALSFLMLAASTLAHAQTGFSTAKIESALLDTQTMNLLLDVRLAHPCDRIASPQVATDATNPTVIRVLATSQDYPGSCIQLIPVKHRQVVNLPAILEMAAVKISQSATYTIEFEGLDKNTKLVVPGSELTKTVLPQPISY